MKKFAFALTTLFSFSLVALAADSTAKISEVHLCCKGCVNGVEKAVGKVPDVKADVDQDAGTVTLTGPNPAAVQKAADEMVAAGYFGKAAGDAVKISPDTGAKGEHMTKATVEGVHLCCGKCVKAVDKAISATMGASGHNATKGAKTFEVTGDFNDKDLAAALQKEGLTGKISKQ